MKNSLAEAGIISDPKSFAVGKRHLNQRQFIKLILLSLTSEVYVYMIVNWLDPEIFILSALSSDKICLYIRKSTTSSAQYLKRFRSISFLKTYTPMEAIYGFFSASSLESPRTAVSTA